MQVPEEMKVNKFRDVMLPSPSEIYARARGQMFAPKAGYTGDAHVDFLEGNKTSINLEQMETELAGPAEE